MAFAVTCKLFLSSTMILSMVNADQKCEGIDCPVQVNSLLQARPGAHLEEANFAQIEKSSQDCTNANTDAWCGAKVGRCDEWAIKMNCRKMCGCDMSPQEACQMDEGKGQAWCEGYAGQSDCDEVTKEICQNCGGCVPIVADFEFVGTAGFCRDASGDRSSLSVTTETSSAICANVCQNQPGCDAFAFASAATTNSNCFLYTESGKSFSQWSSNTEPYTQGSGSPNAVCYRNLNPLDPPPPIPDCGSAEHCGDDPCPQECVESGEKSQTWECVRQHQRQQTTGGWVCSTRCTGVYKNSRNSLYKNLVGAWVYPWEQC